MKKRILAMVMTLAMCLSLLPVSALAYLSTTQKKTSTISFIVENGTWVDGIGGATYSDTKDTITFTTTQFWTNREVYVYDCSMDNREIEIEDIFANITNMDTAQEYFNIPEGYTLVAINWDVQSGG